MFARSAALAFVTALAACASAPPPPPEAPHLVPVAQQPHVAAASTEPPPAPTMDVPEPSRQASYEEALSVPEVVDIEDAHPHLTDVQLWSPIRGALGGCHVPKNAKVTIKTAVQYGHAIGVTVDVRLEQAKSTKRPRPAAVRAERKAIAKMTTCIDGNVRAVAWPPNRRRDSFTTEL